jgi:predicted nucleic acid-binding protein
MFLLDTNVWLERLLDQTRSEEVGRFLAAYPSDHLIITDFSLHSIGVILFKLGKEKVYIEFVDDLLLRGDVTVASLQPQELRGLPAIAKKHKLDFDDAYQFAAAKKYNAVFISYDSDFNGTGIGSRKPSDFC